MVNIPSRETSTSPKTRSVAGRVLTIAGSSIVAAGVAFVVNIISARALGPEYRGHVATVLQLAYLVAPLAGYGADRALLRRTEPDETQSYVLPTTASVIGMGVIAAVVIWPIYGPWAMLAVPTALITLAFSFHRSVAIQSGAIRGYLTAFLFYQASILIGSLALLFLDVRGWQWWAAAYIIPGVVPAFYALRRVLRSTDLRRGGAVQALHRNAALLGASMSRLITTRLNRVILPVIAGTNSLGLFIVVATATEPLYWLAQSLADHQTSIESGRNHSLRSLLTVLAKGALLFALLAAVGGVALYLLLVPLFGQDYAPALNLVLPLTLASVVLASYRQVSGLLLASSTPDSVGVVEGSAAITAVIGYPVAIYLWGAQGAAWGSIAVYAVGLLAGILRYPTSTRHGLVH